MKKIIFVVCLLSICGLFSSGCSFQEENNDANKTIISISLDKNDLNCIVEKVEIKYTQKFFDENNTIYEEVISNPELPFEKEIYVNNNHGVFYYSVNNKSECELTMCFNDYCYVLTKQKEATIFEPF